jgi:hypothetical protein
MVETTHMIRACGVDEAGGLVTVNQLGEFPMEEGILDVELAYPPVEGESDGEDDADGGRFDNRAEGLVEVDAVLLRKTAKDPASLVEVENTVGLELVAKHPFAGDDVHVSRGNEVSCVVREEGAVLVHHGGESVRVLESTAN